MASLKAVIVPAKVLKDGKHKIRISVAHNGETRYIVTDISIDSDKEFKNGVIVKRHDAALLNTKIRGILQRYQEAIDDMVYIEGLSCAELVFQIKNAGNHKHRTLASIYEEYMAYARVTPGTSNEYNNIWSVLSKHLNEKMLIENLNHGTIVGIEKFLVKRGLKSSTIRNYLVFLMVLINYAKRCGYVQYRVEPFAMYELPQKEVRDSWITVDDVKTIRDLTLSKKNIVKCRDLFMLSYYLGGINMVDLFNINFDECKSTIRYVRQKTQNRPKLNKYVEFEIPEEAKPLIEKYKDHNGFLKASTNQRASCMSNFFTYNMGKISSLTGIKNLVYYSARKSFSQHAFNLGISTSIIDYILGHRVDKESTSLFAYISVTPEMATEAIRKVLDNLK